MSKNLCLFINTCHSEAQLLLREGNIILGEKAWEKQKSHSEVITKACQELFEECGRQLNELNQLACVVGPGSFTGIRVGVSFCKTLGYSLNIPCLAINSLELLALNAKSETASILSCMDAQKNSVFVSHFTFENGKWSQPMSNQVIPIQSLHNHLHGKFVVCGDGLKKYKDWIDKNFLADLDFSKEDIPSDLKNIDLENSPLLQPVAMDWNQLQPLYIKASAPEEKLKPTGLS